MALKERFAIDATGLWWGHDAKPFYTEFAAQYDPQIERRTGLKLPERGGQCISKRVRARAGNQQAEGEEQFGKREFEAAAIDVEAMVQVDEKDGAEHDDYRAGCADSQESARENGEAAGKLS